MGLRTPRWCHWQRSGSVDGPGSIRACCESDLYSSQVVEHVEELTAVSVEATQEAALEELLARVTGKWANIEFAVHSYKDTKDVFILGGVEEVVTVLEDSMLTMSTILASR